MLPTEIVFGNGALGQWLTAEQLKMFCLVSQEWCWLYTAHEVALWRAAAEAAWARDEKNNQDTPLFTWLDKAVARECLGGTPDFSARYGWTGVSPWHLAANFSFSSAPEVVHYFLRLGFDNGKDLLAREHMRGFDNFVCTPLKVAIEARNERFVKLLCNSAFGGKDHVCGTHEIELDVDGTEMVRSSVLWLCVNELKEEFHESVWNMFRDILKCGGPELVCSRNNLGVTVMHEVYVNAAAGYKSMVYVAQKLYKVSRDVVQTSRPPFMHVRSYRRYTEWLKKHRCWPVIGEVSPG